MKKTTIKKFGVTFQLREKTWQGQPTGYRVFAKGSAIYSKVVDHINGDTPARALEILFSVRDVFSISLDGAMLDVVSYSKAQVLDEEDAKDILVRGNGFSPYITVKKLNTPDAIEADAIAPLHDPHPRNKSSAKLWGIK